MSISGLQKTGTKYAKRYARLTMLSVAVAVVLTAIVGAASSPTRVAVLPNWLSIPPAAAVFVQFFGLCFAFGLVGRFLFQNLGKLRELFATWVGTPLRERWLRLARRTQAVVFGIWCSLLGGGVATAGVLYYNYSAAVVAAVMVCTWPLATYWLLGRRPATQSTESETLTVRTRYPTLRHLETRTIAALFGFLLTSAVASGLWSVGVDSRSAVGIGVLVWVVSTVVVYNRYESTLETRSELQIVACGPRNNGMVELVVRNNGRDVVELTHATITDTRTDRFYCSNHLELSPASSATLCLPESFAVAPTDSERTLPLGYTLNRSQPTPVVYTRSGVAFELTHNSTEGDEMYVDPIPESTPSTAIGAGTHRHQS